MAETLWPLGAATATTWGLILTLAFLLWLWHKKNPFPTALGGARADSFTEGGEDL